MPPAHLLSLPVWIEQGRSPDPEQAALDWEQARDEWTRGASSLDELNALFGPGFDAGPQADPRVAEYERRTAAAVLAVSGISEPTTSC